MADNDLVTCPTCQQQVSRAILVYTCENCGKELKRPRFPGQPIVCSFDCAMNGISKAAEKIIFYQKLAAAMNKAGKKQG